MKHAPLGYECPFCDVSATLQTAAAESAVVLVDNSVFAMIPLHHYGDIRGNCLIVPRRHYENLFDIPDALGVELAESRRP